MKVFSPPFAPGAVVGFKNPNIRTGKFDFIVTTIEKCVLADGEKKYQYILRGYSEFFLEEELYDMPVRPHFPFEV